MANDKIPFGGRDWNHDGKYDNFERMTDFYVYKKVTEDWEKNGAWDKKKKAKQHYSAPLSTSGSDADNAIGIICGIISLIVIICVIGWAIENGVLLGLIGLVVICALIAVIL